jgi:hypothetical protein
VGGRRRAPSQRWSSQHGGRGLKRRAGYPGKVVHATRREARVHLARILLRDVARNVRAGRWRVWRYHAPPRDLRTYPCRWGDSYRDGEGAPVHWHVGRRPGGE